MNLIIVDDNLHFLKDLKYFIEAELKHAVIAEASSGEDFLGLKNITQADIILMDLRMMHINGFEATRQSLWHYPMIKFIAITNDTKNTTLNKLIETGFMGLVRKSDVFISLELALKTVKSGKLFFSNDINTE